MSQAKVDRYKEQKANRQKIMQKEKREKMLWKAGAYVVLLVLVAWIGFSAYSKFHVETRKFYTVDTTAVDTYMNSLSTEAAAEEDTTEAVNETEETAEDATEAADETAAETVAE